MKNQNESISSSARNCYAAAQLELHQISSVHLSCGALSARVCMSFRRKFSRIPRAGVPLKNPACLGLARSAALGIFFFSQTLPSPINLINDLALVYIYVCVPVYPRAAALYISISLPLPSSLALIADVQAKIAGAGEVFVRKGSTISLTCTVNSQGVPPSNVTWYHAGTIIDFDGPRLVHIHTYIYIFVRGWDFSPY